jgi:hypothetical protein
MSKTGALRMSQDKIIAIENAEGIIERFGGIRPMATKINVPVTTVQGWKKRNIIPGTRRDEILQAARQLGVDLSDIMGGQSEKIANQNVSTDKGEERAAPIGGSEFSKMVEDSRTSSFSGSPQADKSALRGNTASLLELNTPIEKQIEKELARSESRAVAVSTMINVLLVLMAVGSVVLMLAPQQDRRIAALEGNVRGLQAKQNFLSGLTPVDVQTQIAALRSQFSKLEASLGSILGTAQRASGDVLSPTAGDIGQRAARLENQVNDMSATASTEWNALIQRLQGLSESLGGQEQLKTTAMQLSALLSGVPENDPAAIDRSLQVAQENPQIAKTFQGVAPQDLKAAAMLLAMTQFRSSLNRDNEPFAQDLVLLKKLAGADDPELQASLDRLAPFAEQGVLTPAGLTQEFRGLAGDVVVASLQGEDVSLKDKARARLGDMFTLEKNGEPVSGTPTQKTLAKTNKMLELGDLEGAVAQLQTLDGPAAMAAQPWITKAQATLLAQKIKHLLSGNGGGGKIYNSAPIMPAAMPSARGLNIPGSSQLIQNEISGQSPPGQ